MTSPAHKKSWFSSAWTPIRRFASRAIMTVSTLALVITMATWVESYFPPTYVLNLKRPERVVVVSPFLGFVAIAEHSDPITIASPQFTDARVLETWPNTPALLSPFEIAPLLFRWPFVETIPGSTTVWIPHWMLALVFSLVPGITVLRRCASIHTTRVRESRGLCSMCGYDLRGSPGSVCPECGTKSHRQGETRPMAGPADQR